jgi:hypothetical protein
MRSPAPGGRKAQIRSRSGGPRSLRGGEPPAWPSHWRCHPGRTAGGGLRALSPRARARRCAGSGRLCLHSQPTALSNGRFYGTLEWQFPADVSVRTAEIGGRRRQTQDDHQGRVGIQLAVWEFAHSRHSVPLLAIHKAVAERLGEKVRRKDYLREVAKSAVRADKPTAAMLPAATTVGMSSNRQKRRKASCGPRQRGETLSSQSPTTMYLLKRAMRFSASVSAH